MEVRDLPLAATFRIATKAWDVARNVFLELSFGGVTGIGEVSPDARWGESPESVASELEGLDLSALNGPFDLEGLTNVLPAGSPRAALDIAMHDLAAKLAGISLSQLLGVAGRRLPPTSLTLPIAEVGEMVERARAHSDHPILKLKVGFEGDVAAVGEIRKFFGGRLRIDANEGWDQTESIGRLERLELFDIELCEQPIRAGDLEALREIASSTSIPIFADEDVSTAEDVVRLADVVDGVNLKLRKTGGIREALRAIAVARAHGLGVMLGCDLESGVAATAEAHLASLVDFADIDGPLLLARDPWPGVRYDKGMLSLPQGPGLGVTPAT